VAARRSAGLLLELALGDRERLFAFGVLALRDRPGPEVLLSPEWAAWMDEQELEATVASPVHQDAGASLRHGGAPENGRRGRRAASTQLFAAIDIYCLTSRALIFVVVLVRKRHLGRPGGGQLEIAERAGRVAVDDEADLDPIGVLRDLDRDRP